MADLRETARKLGLERLSDEHLAQLGRAFETMERHLKRLPRDLPADSEMALIFRAREPS